MKLHCKSLLLVLVLASCALGFDGRDSQKDEVATLIASAKFLEESPLEKGAKDVRRKAVEWIIATDKVSVIICPVITKGLEEKYKYQSEIFGQYTIGMAAFKLSNSGNKDENSAQVAGYESALRSYEAILKQQPKAKHPFLDDLLVKRSDGTLAQFAADSCKAQK